MNAFLNDILFGSVFVKYVILYVLFCYLFLKFSCFICIAQTHRRQIVPQVLIYKKSVPTPKSTSDFSLFNGFLKYVPIYP